jgi:hypothetical protein
MSLRLSKEREEKEEPKEEAKEEVEKPSYSWCFQGDEAMVARVS